MQTHHDNKDVFQVLAEHALDSVNQLSELASIVRGRINNETPPSELTRLARAAAKLLVDRATVAAKITPDLKNHLKPKKKIMDAA